MSVVPLVIIPDPELLLPDETLRPAEAYRAESAFFGRDYVSLAALLKGRAAAEYQLNQQMLDWQRALAAPTYVAHSLIRDDTKERLWVYAHVVTPLAFLDTERAAGLDESKKRRLVKRMENAHQRGWIYARWHSRTQPDGEYGSIHRAYIQREVPEAEFLALAAAGWTS